MDFLMDAAEDCRLVEAMGTGPPLPTASFPEVFPATLAKWKAAMPPSLFEPHTLLSQRLGFYLFISFLLDVPETKSSRKGSRTLAMFVVSCAKFRMLRGTEADRMAFQIKVAFLDADGGVDFANAAKKGSAKAADRKTFDPTGLFRELPGKYSSIEGDAFASSAQIGKGKGAGKSRSRNALRADGAILDECRDAIPNGVDSTTFQKLEAAVFAALLQDAFPDFEKSPYYEKLLGFLLIQGEPVTERDFNALRVLGRGGFGLVTGAKKSTTGKLYVLKSMSKRRVKLNMGEALALGEREALGDVESPFVVTLSYAFASRTELFLCLEMMTGGDLSFHLKTRKRFSEAESLYFGARVLLGLAAMHERGYVYRDLKPENVLMGADGRVKITDLGLACRATATLKGAAGTRGYWGPEMLRKGPDGKKVGYDHMVDWFSFGCVLAEFMTGVNPFRSNRALYWSKVVNRTEKGWQDKALDDATMNMDPFWDPQYIELEAADLLTQLTMKFAKDRIGYNNGNRKDGCREIMAHPWFKTIDWDMIRTELHPPPFVPARDVNAASQEDIGDFEDAGLPELNQKDQDLYSKWNWTNPRSFQKEVVEFLAHESNQGKPLVLAKKGCCTVA